MSSISDEEYGRAWAAQQGKSLLYKPDTSHPWQWNFFPDNWPIDRGLDLLAKASVGGSAGCFQTENEAYARLGQTVREINRLVPSLSPV